MENILLVGAQDVQVAANDIRRGADDMNHAAAEFENSLFRHRQFMDEWLGKFEQIVTDAVQKVSS